jgi:hypothetical protein
MVENEVGPVRLRWMFNHIAHHQLALAPANKEGFEVYENHQFDPTAKQVTIAIYNSKVRCPFGFGACGDNFRQAGMQRKFDIRVNAVNGADAARRVDEFLKSRSFTGGISLIELFDHGASGQPMLGDMKIGDELFQLFGKYPLKDELARFVFLGCSVACGSVGKKYMQQKSNFYRIGVVANEDKTGWESGHSEGEANYKTNDKAWFEARPNELSPAKTAAP